MTGQDAVKTAKAFDDTLGISGSILTKLDGDARGGAAPSVKDHWKANQIPRNGALDKLEEFRPEGIADRILGFKRHDGLVQDFEGVIDEKKAEEDAKKILSGDFTLTFLEQIRTIKKMGSLKDIFEKMPFMQESWAQRIWMIAAREGRGHDLVHDEGRAEQAPTSPAAGALESYREGIRYDQGCS